MIRYIKKLNNNIILAQENEQEIIVIGSGLGFGHQPGDEIAQERIDQIYIPQEQKYKDIEMLADLPYENILLASKMIEFGKTFLERELNQGILITLADHITFAMKQAREGIELQNPLYYEIRQIYPREVALGEQILELIQEKTNITLPQTESVALAMHFVNAEYGQSDLPTTIKIAQISHDIVSIVQEDFQAVLDEQSFDFTRFIAHLRYFILRQMRTDIEALPEDEDLYQLVKQNYPIAFACCLRACSYLQQQHGYQPNKSEQLYLTLHIKRVTDTRKKHT